MWVFGKLADSPRHKFLSWQTILLWIVLAVAEVRSVALAFGIAVAVVVFDFCATIGRHQETKCSNLCRIFLKNIL